MKLGTPAQALAFVKKEGFVTLVPRFVEAVAGERVRGSWWGHPKGQLIFRLAESLEDSKDVVSLKLLEGKTTFVHRKLWPTLLAVVMNEAWRKERSKRLSAAAKALWKRVEVSSRRGEAPGPVKELEASLLVHCVSEHTEKGRHEKRLTSWSQWAKTHQAAPAELEVTAALERLGME
jgi:hypothetical protein